MWKGKQINCTLETYKGGHKHTSPKPNSRSSTKEKEEKEKVRNPTIP